jgi:hypothetical protein
LLGPFNEIEDFDLLKKKETFLPYSLTFYKIDSCAFLKRPHSILAVNIDFARSCSSSLNNVCKIIIIEATDFTKIVMIIFKEFS